MITWVNHASFLYQNEDIVLLTDPWFEGEIFNKGWRLLAPTVLDKQKIADVTHIWFSHEHPDHFHPPTLKKIRELSSSGVTVLFQKTKDKRVIAYCKKLGFQVNEIAEGEVFKTGNTELRVGRVPFYDSWMSIKSPRDQILNLNDCVIKSEEQCLELQKQSGLSSVDIVMTQFGYASWVGNPNEAGRHKRAASERLARIAVVDKVFKPKSILLFASFIRFCHEENLFLNENNNGVTQAWEFVSKKCKGKPVVLAPGDTWDLHPSRDCRQAIRFYEEKIQLNEIDPDPISTDSVSFVDLQRLANVYRDRLAKKNNVYVLKIARSIGFLSKLQFYLWDLDCYVEYDPASGVHSIDPPSDDLIELSSDSLSFIFKFEFGFDTLSVNGRFRCSSMMERKMFKTFGVGSLNNMGKSLTPALLFDYKLWIRVLKKVIK